MSSFACPSCSGDTVVKDSRPTGNGPIRRRRECTSCGVRVTTYEMTLESVSFKFLPALAGLIDQAKALVDAATTIQSHAAFMQDMEDRRHGGSAINRPTQTPQE